MICSNYESTYWMENDEWSYEDENGEIHIKDDAPERAKRSFELWKHPVAY